MQPALSPPAGVMIVSLADHLDQIPRLAQWHWREWGDDHPEDSEAAWRDTIARRVSRDAVPFTLLAFLDDTLVGCLSVCWDDVDGGYADEGPWLSGLFVQGPARNLGIGRALVSAAERRCADFGYRELWLHTGEADRFYERCGWTTVRARARPGFDAVMRRDLTSARRRTDL